MGVGLCPPALVDSVLAEVFDELLSKVEFRKVGTRTYVRRRVEYIDDVIKLHGGWVSLGLTWGFSLTFVPHITGGVENVRWHRTIKSAQIDLFDPEIHSLPRFWSITAHQGEGALRRSALSTRFERIPNVLNFFDGYARFRDLDALFRRIRGRDKFGWSLKMFPQTFLAYAFYLAKAGREQEARHCMSAWLAQFSGSYREETTVKISALFEKAANSPYVLH